jgi:hypothetical protein
MTSEQLAAHMAYAIGNPPPGTFSARMFTATEHKEKEPRIDRVTLSAARSSCHLVLNLSRACVQWVAERRPTAKECIDYLNNPKGPGDTEEPDAAEISKWAIATSPAKASVSKLSQPATSPATPTSGTA